jgi:hypothetical protein
MKKPIILLFVAVVSSSTRGLLRHSESPTPLLPRLDFADINFPFKLPKDKWMDVETAINSEPDRWKAHISLEVKDISEAPPHLIPFMERYEQLRKTVNHYPNFGYGPADRLIGFLDYNIAYFSVGCITRTYFWFFEHKSGSGKLPLECVAPNSQAILTDSSNATLTIEFEQTRYFDLFAGKLSFSRQQGQVFKIDADKLTTLGLHMAKMTDGIEAVARVANDLGRAEGPSEFSVELKVRPKEIEDRGF